MKKRKNTTPLLSALAASMLCASLVSTVSAHGIYEKYNAGGWSQPSISVLMQGLAHGGSPGSPPTRPPGRTALCLRTARPAPACFRTLWRASQTRQSLAARWTGRMIPGRRAAPPLDNRGLPRTVLPLNRRGFRGRLCQRAAGDARRFGCPSQLTGRAEAACFHGSDPGIL